MAEINLSQAEADALIAVEKERVNDDKYNYPDIGERISVPLVSSNKREHFMLDVRRSRIDLAKGTYQNRGREVVVLVRLDFGSAPHRNPDGEEIGSPHLHVYREGFGDKWASALPSEHFVDLDDRLRLLDDFMRYCNIVKPPVIERGLFT